MNEKTLFMGTPSPEHRPANVMRVQDVRKDPSATKYFEQARQKPSTTLEEIRGKRDMYRFMGLEEQFALDTKHKPQEQRLYEQLLVEEENAKDRRRLTEVNQAIKEQPLQKTPRTMQASFPHPAGNAAPNEQTMPFTEAELRAAREAYKNKSA